MLKRLNHKKLSNVVITITLSPKEKETYYMLWEVKNPDMLDFLTALKDVVHLEDWNDYTIISNTVTLHDQENFYCALLLYLQGNHEPNDDDIENSMVVEICKKTA